MKVVRAIAVTALAGLFGMSASAHAERALYTPRTKLPERVDSPAVDQGAPYTPTVVSLLKQLEPDQPDPVHDARPAVGTTTEQIGNAASLLHGTVASQSPGSCTGAGLNVAPTGTTPAIAPLCWVDAMGVNVTSGNQLRRTTAQPLLIGLASSWDTRLLNAWGQVMGEEGRQVGMTGIYAPQSDVLRIPNWGRNLSVLGEDPFQDGVLSAAEINGIQGKGLMNQTKHFAFFNGQLTESNTSVQDQASHEIYLQPYEYGANGSGQLPHPGQAAAMMCSYQHFQIAPAPGSSAPASVLGPTAGDFACNHNAKNVVAHGQWGWQGFFASDYVAAMFSTIQAINSGTDQEMPTSIWYGDQLTLAVMSGAVPLSTFNRALARILYQQERFHLLGHADADSDYLSASSPVSTTGEVGITPSQKARHAAISERGAEEGAVLLKDTRKTLPISRRDLRDGVLVVGEAAEYMPAMPANEAAQGFPDRDQISPLAQLKRFAPKGSRIVYIPSLPAGRPGDGRVVPRRALSTDGGKAGNGLKRTAGPQAGRTDATINFTALSKRGHLTAGQTYTWTGYVDVPRPDAYAFHFQFSVADLAPGPAGAGGGGGFAPPNPGAVLGGSAGACGDPSAPQFSIAAEPGAGQDMTAATLAAPPTTTAGVATGLTMTGVTERGLANCMYDAGTLPAGQHQVQLTWKAPASLGTDAYNLREPGVTSPSLRFAYSRAAGDRADAIAAAKTAAKVLVFADPANPAVSPTDVAYGPNVNSLDGGTVELITTLSRSNPRLAVVLNSTVAVLMPWLDKARAVLEMWWPGSEGGTATARLLLGKANPGGHLTTTWPAHASDTVFAYDQQKPLYAGDSAGAHPERLSGAEGTNFSEGIYVGYRFFDREAIKPLFPFGWGRSYTRLRLSNPTVRPRGGGYDVSFTLKNVGRAKGAAVPQIYVGPAPSVPVGVQQADRALAGFDRLVMRPGQSRRRTIRIGPGMTKHGHGDVRAFQYWSSPDQKWMTAPGRRAVWVGMANANLRRARMTR